MEYFGAQSYVSEFNSDNRVLFDWGKNATKYSYVISC